MSWLNDEDREHIRALMDKAPSLTPLQQAKIAQIAGFLAGTHGPPRQPVRLQRSRERGWRMPPGAVYVGRPTRWGNPFPVGPDQDRGAAVAAYRQWLAQPEQAPLRERIRAELHERDLVCWCPLDEPCHADVLLEEARSQEVK
jgi:Domain of unknown function (DUF4326)